MTVDQVVYIYNNILTLMLNTSNVFFTSLHLTAYIYLLNKGLVTLCLKKQSQFTFMR